MIYRLLQIVRRIRSVNYCDIYTYKIHLNINVKSAGESYFHNSYDYYSQLIVNYIHYTFAGKTNVGLNIRTVPCRNIVFECNCRQWLIHIADGRRFWAHITRLIIQLLCFQILRARKKNIYTCAFLNFVMY